MSAPPVYVGPGPIIRVQLGGCLYLQLTPDDAIHLGTQLTLKAQDLVARTDVVKLADEQVQGLAAALSDAD